MWLFGLGTFCCAIAGNIEQIVHLAIGTAVRSHNLELHSTKEKYNQKHYCTLHQMQL